MKQFEITILLLLLWVFSPFELKAQTNDSLVIPSKIDSTRMDTFSKVMDKVKRDSLFEFKWAGFISNEIYISSGKYAGQQIPQYYIHTSVSNNLELLGIPFNLNLFLASEDISHSQNMSGVGFSFDQAKLQKILAAKAARNPGTFESQHQLDSLNNILDAQRKEINQLSYQIKQKDAQKKLTEYQNILKRAESDSVYAWKNRAKVNHARIEYDGYQSKCNRLDSVIRVSKSIQSKIGSLKAIREFEMNPGQLHNVSGMKDTLKSYSSFSIPPILKGFQLKKLELMDFYTNASILTLNGVRIRGVNFEMGNGKLYFGYCGGKINSNGANVFSWNQNTWNKSGTIHSFRAGIGDLDKSYIGVMFQSSKPAIYDSALAHSPIQKNIVFGLQGRVNLGLNFYLLFEQAFSRSTTTFESTSKREFSISEIIKNGYTSATFINLNGVVPKFNTEINSTFRRDGLLYYSDGISNNRKDCYRFDIKVQQPFIKGKLRVSIAMRFDQDNLSGIKLMTNKTSTLDGSVFFRHKKMSFRFFYKKVMSQLQPIRMTISSVDIYSFTVTRNSKLLGYNSNLMLSWNLSNTKTNYLGHNTGESQLNSVDLSHIWFIGSKLNLLTGGNMMLYNAISDTGSSVSATIKSGYSLSKNMQVSLGYRYVQMIYRENRHVQLAGAAYKTKNQSIGLNIEYTIISGIAESAFDNRILSGRVVWIINF